MWDCFYPCFYITTDRKHLIMESAHKNCNSRCRVFDMYFLTYRVYGNEKVNLVPKKLLKLCVREKWYNTLMLFVCLMMQLFIAVQLVKISYMLTKYHILQSPHDAAYTKFFRQKISINAFEAHRQFFSVKFRIPQPFYLLIYHTKTYYI